MVSLKQLENERIEKIKSLNEKQVIGYIDILLKDLIKYGDYEYIKENLDSAIVDLSDVNDKLKEIVDLTGDRFNNIENAIQQERLIYISGAKLINDFKTDITDFKYKNSFIRLYLADTIFEIRMLKVMIYSLYSMFLISDNDVIKKGFIDGYVRLIPECLKKIKSQLDFIKYHLFNVDDGDEYIYDLKLQMAELIESNDKDKVVLKDLGILNVYTSLIDETMEMLKLETKVDDVYSLIAEFDVDNVFESFSVASYECYSDIPFVTFDDFMKSEPKFNAVNGELIEPISSLISLFE